MINGLCRQVEAHGGLRDARRFVSDFHPTKVQQPFRQGRPVDEHQVGTELLPLLRLFHLALRLLHRQSLCRETVGIDPVGHVAHVAQIFHHHHGVCRKEIRERHLALRAVRQFGHDDYFLLFVPRQLALHLERADAVHFVAKEIHAIGPLGRIGEHIEDAAAHGELPRLVNIVHLREAERAQRLLHEDDVHPFSCMQHQCPFLQALLRHDLLHHRVGIGHDEQRAATGRKAANDLRAQDFVGRIALPELHRAAERRREIKHLLFAQDLRQVVVKITRLLGIVQNKQKGTARHLRAGHGQPAEQQRSGRGAKPLGEHRPHGSVLQRPRQSLYRLMPRIQGLQTLYLHDSKHCKVRHKMRLNGQQG